MNNKRKMKKKNPKKKKSGAGNVKGRGHKNLWEIINNEKEYPALLS
jgi:hypothetical protein